MGANLQKDIWKDNVFADETSAIYIKIAWDTEYI